MIRVQAKARSAKDDDGDADDNEGVSDVTSSLHLINDDDDDC